MAAFSGELLEYAQNISGEAKEKLKQYAEEGAGEIRGDFIRCKMLLEAPCWLRSTGSC
ncbi:MAG: hypothetical protein K1W40_01805 [Schaedlerella sp.]|uniref:hypothetical protein n=1 Tax=Schaedlerella sp. TaxID=2676057 RepID=UPI0035295AB9